MKNSIIRLSQPLLIVLSLGTVAYTTIDLFRLYGQDFHPIADGSLVYSLVLMNLCALFYLFKLSYVPPASLPSRLLAMIQANRTRSVLITTLALAGLIYSNRWQFHQEVYLQFADNPRFQKIHLFRHIFTGQTVFLEESCYPGKLATPYNFSFKNWREVAPKRYVLRSVPVSKIRIPQEVLQLMQRMQSGGCL